MPNSTFKWKVLNVIPVLKDSIYNAPKEEQKQPMYLS